MLWECICTVHLTVCFYHVTNAFYRKSTLYSCLKVKKLLARNRRIVTATGPEPTTTYFANEHTTILPNWANDWAVLWVSMYTVHLTVYYYHVTYALKSESFTYFEDIRNKNLSILDKWFLNNKLSIHFGEGRTEDILFSESKLLWKLNKLCRDHIIKQYDDVEYIKWHVVSKIENLWKWKFEKKVNAKVKFL